MKALKKAFELVYAEQDKERERRRRAAGEAAGEAPSGVELCQCDDCKDEENYRSCCYNYKNLLKRYLCAPLEHPELSIAGEDVPMYRRLCCCLGKPGDKSCATQAKPGILRRGEPCEECGVKFKCPLLRASTGQVEVLTYEKVAHLKRNNETYEEKELIAKKRAISELIPEIETFMEDIFLPHHWSNKWTNQCFKKHRHFLASDQVDIKFDSVPKSNCALFYELAQVRLRVWLRAQSAICEDV